MGNTHGATAFRTCDVRIDPINMDDAVATILRWASGAWPAAVHLCNAYTLSLARKDPALAATIERGDLNLMDGMPLVWTARRHGFDVDGRVYGPDLMLAVLDRGRRLGVRHYLFGAAPDVIDALGWRLRRTLPGLELVGAESPPFRELSAEEEGAVAERIRRSRADIVWVGLGTPKQDIAVDRLRQATGAVCIAIGAAFDFHAGAKKQAPTWMQDRGLEWAFRLVTEPRRLWRRYLVGNAVFLAGLAAGVELVRGPCDRASSDG